MGQTEKNRMVLIESGDSVSCRMAAKYREAYVYSGNLRGAKGLSDDFLDLIDYYTSHYRAGEAIDWVYEQYVESGEAEVLNRAIGDKRAHLAIKKAILLALGDLFLSFIMAEKFVKKYDVEETIDFLPNKFSYTLYQIVFKRKDLMPDRVNIPEWYIKKMKRLEFGRNSVYRAGLVLYPLTVSMLMNLGRAGKTGKKNYRYGVHIWNGWVRSSSSSARIGFLEDKNGINQANTLYILDYKIKRRERKADLKKVKNSGYDYCRFEEIVRGFSVWRYFGEIYPAVRRVAKEMFSLCGGKGLLARSYLRTLRRLILWEIFFSNYAVDLFVALQDPGNIPRTLLQKKNGADSIFVFTSTSYDPVYRENMDTHADSNYSFMVYDAAVSSRMSNDYFRRNNNLINEYVNCGILLSDNVYRVRQDAALKARIKKELGISPNKAVIGFYDTKIGKMGMLNNQEGYRMINDVYRLLESNKDYYILFKSRGYYRYSGNSDVKKEIDRLIAHERVIHVNETKAHSDYDARCFMGICDLVIGTFTSSAPLESVAGGIRTICYVPSERFNKDVFAVNTFPRFCARGYDQLKEYTEYWLNECSEDDFRCFLDTYVKKHVDDYCDGQAMKRLHSLLDRYSGPAHERPPREKLATISK